MKRIHIWWIMIMCMLFCGCISNPSEKEDKYWIYHVNYKKGGLEKTEYTLEEGQEKLNIDEVAEILSGKGKSEISILPTGVELLGYSLSEGVLNLNFNSNYRKIVFTDEILCRAAFVKTFVQVPEVRYVQFFIEGEDLPALNGSPIGLMNNSSFVEFSGENLGDIQSKKLLLYFANKEGNELVSETRTVYYSSSAPIEKVIVEQLIQGPQKGSCRGTLPSNTGIIGVSVANGIVYVNLDQKVLSDTVTVGADISIYSIVNSVLSLGNATHVQISINGDSKVKFKETVDLSQSFEFNFELLQDGDKNMNVIPHIISDNEDE